MRHLYYTLQTLLRGRGSNIIKVISLYNFKSIKKSCKNLYERLCHRLYSFFFNYFIVSPYDLQM